MLLTLSLWYVEVKVQNILKLKTNVLTTCFYKVFLKKKRGWNWFSYLIFYTNFEEKNFSRYNLSTDQISLPD